MPVLIIPSAKLVPEELQSLGKFPAVIYPVNQRIVFDYLYDKYINTCELIKVICYEEAEKVRRRLFGYKNDHVSVESLDRLEDLGYTVYCALRDIEGAVIINFADTIILDDVDSAGMDSYFYAEEYRSEKWTFFTEEQGRISSIEDKRRGDKKGCGKLFVGLFRISDAACFRECLAGALLVPKRGMDSFFYALRRYSEIHPMEAIKATDWFDIGHADTYYNSKLEVKAREFNHISIDKNRGMLCKTSEDNEKFIGEIKWYLKIPEAIEYVRPRIFDYSTSYNAPYVLMEYYSYHTLHELYLYGDLLYNQWVEIFKRIRFVCNDFRKYTLKDPDIQASLEDMYLTKTMQRFEMLRKERPFRSFFERGIIINGVKYKTLDEIEGILRTEVPKRLYDVRELQIIHGDLCFTNIMIDGNFSFIKLIDPRGKFGRYDIYGDFRYDLSKLLHSIDGKYDYIIKDLFTVDYDLDENRITYSIRERKSDYNLYEMFLNVFSEEIREDLPKLELIESLLFLSMIPLHTESLRHQMVMLGTGLEILGRVLEIQDKQYIG